MVTFTNYAVTFFVNVTICTNQSMILLYKDNIIDNKR